MVLSVWRITRLVRRFHAPLNSSAVFRGCSVQRSHSANLNCLIARSIGGSGTTQESFTHDFRFLNRIFSRDAIPNSLGDPTLSLSSLDTSEPSKVLYDLVVLNLGDTICASSDPCESSSSSSSSLFSERSKMEQEESPPMWSDPTRKISGVSTQLQTLLHLCIGAERVIAADGGANALHSLHRYISEITGISMLDERVSERAKQAIVPKAICGDLDSVLPRVLDFFEHQGSERQIMADQDSSDFEKTLRFAVDSLGDDDKSKDKVDDDSDGNIECQKQSVRYVIAYGAFGTRFDHEVQAMNILRKFETDSRRDQVRLILMSAHNCAVLLPSGSNNILCSGLTQGPTCGLLPIFGPSTVRSDGLKWELKDQELRFGGLISTSNRLTDYETGVEIDNDGDLVFHTCMRFPQYSL